MNQNKLFCLRSRPTLVFKNGHFGKQNNLFWFIKWLTSIQKELNGHLEERL